MKLKILERTFFLPLLVLSSCGKVSKPTNTVVGIEIVNPPVKVDYLIGDEFDPTGVVIKEKMKNESLGKEITDYDYSPKSPLTVDDTEVTFSYKDFQVSQPINVGDVIVASQIKKFDDGRTYLEVDGEPFAIKSAQLRVDGLLNRSPYLPDAPAALSYAEIDKYFVAAKAANLNAISLAIQWSNVETSKDVYDFSLVDALLTHANNHNLKCEFLWFGSNMCGDSYSYQLPAYIFDDTATYPRFEFDPVGYSGMYGVRTYLKVDTEAYLVRERKVIEALMNHIYEWNLANGRKNPLIGIQVHNETDGLIRWRRDQRQIKENGQLVSYSRLWTMLLTSLNNAGKAFKNSKYKLYTRCNITTSYGVDEYPQCPGTGISPKDIYHLEGIDIIGDDPYVTNPTTINNTMRYYRFENNYPHVAENMGNYANSPSLFLTAFQAGGSYIFYDLATPEYFVYLNGGGSYQMDQGIYNPDLSLKAHSQATFDIVKPIKSMGSILPHVVSENFAAFNVNSTDPAQSLAQTINTSNVSFTFETSNSAIGFAIEDGEYVYLAANKDSRIKINNANTAPYAEVGEVVHGEFVSAEKAYPTDYLNLQAGKLYRLKITKILNEVSSTTNDNI